MGDPAALVVLSVMRDEEDKVATLVGPWCEDEDFGKDDDEEEEEDEELTDSSRDADADAGEVRLAAI